MRWRSNFPGVFFNIFSYIFLHFNEIYIFFDFYMVKFRLQTIILLEAASWISRQCQKGVPMLELILYFGPVILVVLLVLLIITQGYVKAPPDHAYIISGLRKEPRVLVGRAGLKLPFFEQA